MVLSCSPRSVSGEYIESMVLYSHLAITWYPATPCRGDFQRWLLDCQNFYHNPQVMRPPPFSVISGGHKGRNNEVLYFPIQGSIHRGPVANWNSFSHSKRSPLPRCPWRLNTQSKCLPTPGNKEAVPPLLPQQNQRNPSKMEV